MDRHEVPGTTAKALAEAHRLDLDIQDNYGCKALTYWFDENKGIVFCLIEAPDKKAVEEMHRNSHGLIPNQIIEVQGNIVELFLGRILDPVVSDKTDEFEHFINETAFRTIMYIDFKYPWIQLPSKRNELSAIISELIIKYNGREVKYIYNGQMASFISTANSVDCAVEIINKVNLLKKNDETITCVSIGLSTGAPVTDKGDFFGEAIILAKRLCEIAGDEQIFITSAVKNLYSNYLNTSFLKILNPEDEKFLNQLMKITELDWNKAEFSTNNLSLQIGMSKAQLYRKMISLTGNSPNEFIRKYRLDRALKLIENKKGNISEIAFESGFGSLSYFTKCFQKRYEILPSDYAQKII